MSNLSKNTKVRLGDGREGVIVRKEERNNFHGYIVKITKSVDKSQIGTTVGATEPGMKFISQLQPLQSVDTEVSTEQLDPEIFIKKQKDIIDKRIPHLQEEITLKQQELTQLQQMVAVTTTPEVAKDQFENLERQEKEDQTELEQQQDINMQQQQIGVEQQQFQMEQSQQQQQQLKQSSTNWIKSEKANIKIAVRNSVLFCDVAATIKQQASGLQAYSKLDENCGLWFPFARRRKTSFHMGEVKFPIDIIFVDCDNIIKIVSNIKPRQCGSWSATCTDVIETNGNWCKKNGIKVGDNILTPLSKTTSNGKDDTEEDKEATKSYDLLRSITMANLSGNELRKAVCKIATEHRLPDTTDKRTPEIDKRNPQNRYLHNDTADVRDPEGDKNPNMVFDTDVGKGSFDKNFHMQRGYDIALGEDYGVAVRPTAQKIPGFNEEKLLNSIVIMFDQNGPDWLDEDLRGFNQVAIIDDSLISRWIDSLGFDEINEQKLRKIMFTDELKRMIANALIDNARIEDFELLDSDLILYK